MAFSLSLSDELCHEQEKFKAISEELDQTFAEIDPAAKHAISHRADAFKKLVTALF